MTARERTRIVEICANYIAGESESGIAERYGITEEDLHGIIAMYRAQIGEALRRTLGAPRI